MPLAEQGLRLSAEVFPHYLYDRNNSPWPIYRLVKTGGGREESLASGIHWHMNIAVKIEFAARDKKMQDIPWVRITDKATGKTDVYQNAVKPFSAGELSAANVRVMDCIDCHNRPSHLLHPPDYLADRLISSGRMDRGLPEIKKAAVWPWRQIINPLRTRLPASGSPSKDFTGRIIPESTPLKKRP